MRIAFIGKGGSGKSTIAGTVARLLARDGEPVLALDVDTMPGLAFSIGLGHVGDAGLPEELAERREGKRWVMREEMSAEELVDRYATDAPDGIRYLQLGKLPGHVRPGSVTAFRHVVEHFRRPGWSLVGDLAAGTRQGFGGWADFASLLAIVVEPTPAAILSARRLRQLAGVVSDATAGVILNKVRDAGAGASGRSSTSERIRRELDLPLWGVVPHDEAIIAAERAGRAPVDAAPESSAVLAIAELVSELQASMLGERRT